MTQPLQTILFFNLCLPKKIDFKKKRPCGGVTTQGLSSPTRKWFVQKFIARHSVDLQTWTDVADEGGNTIVRRYFVK